MKFRLSSTREHRRYPRVRIVYTDFHHGWGGQALQVLQLARAMADRGHDPLILAPPDSDLAVRTGAAGLPVDTRCRFPRGFRPRALLADLRALRALFSERPVDLVHCHGSQDTWIAVAVARLFGGPPIVRTKHNTYPVRPHAANRWLYGRALAHVIAVAGPIAADLVDNGLVPADRVTVLHAGLDDRFAGSAARSRSAVRAAWGFSEDTPLVGLVGRLAPDKGQDTLLRAAAILRERHPDFRHVPIGTGGDWDRIRMIIHHPGLHDVGKWAGLTEDVAPPTRSPDLPGLAAPARRAPTPPVKEATAPGGPAGGARGRGTAEILEDGACGLLIRPGDPGHLAKAIASIFDDPDAAGRRAERARARVRRYLASAVAEETERIYERVRTVDATQAVAAEATP